MKTRFVFAAAPCVLLAIAAGAACSSSDLCVGAACGSSSDDASVADGSSTDATTSSDGGAQPDAVAPPPGCDATGDVATQAACVSDAYGVFVNASVGDAGTGSGTKEAPYGSINVAITKAVQTGHNNVFICAGTYAEHVVISSNVNLYGGFDCGTWAQPVTAPMPPSTVVEPSDEGYALELTNASSTIENIVFTARDGVDAGDSSVAVFASNSNAVTFRNAVISAGDAGVSPKKPAIVPNYAGLANMGTNASSQSGVATQVCSPCSNGDVSDGGFSGSGGPGSGGNGGTGAPSLTVFPADTTPPHDGEVGAGASGSNGCTNGDPGAFSTDADAGASALVMGTIGGSVGWAGSIGLPGLTARVAQGGGGGGGGVSATAGAGGGGGCGGCGGGGGAGGGAGGSSFAVLSYKKHIDL